MNRADVLVGHNVTPVPSAEKQVYALAIGEIIERYCLRMIDQASHREQIINQETFRVQIDGNVHIFSIPGVEEFIQHTKMKCLEVVEQNNILVEAIIIFREAAFGSTKGYVIPMEMEWSAHAFTGAESYTPIERKSPAVQNRIDKYFT
jgi:hypothetical protein